MEELRHLYRQPVVKLAHLALASMTLVTFTPLLAWQYGLSPPGGFWPLGAAVGALVSLWATREHYRMHWQVSTDREEV